MLDETIQRLLTNANCSSNKTLSDLDLAGVGCRPCNPSTWEAEFWGWLEVWRPALLCLIVNQHSHWACWQYGHSGGTQGWLGVGERVVWAIRYIQQLKASSSGICSLRFSWIDTISCNWNTKISDTFCTELTAAKHSQSLSTYFNSLGGLHSSSFQTWKSKGIQGSLLKV